MAKRLIPLFNRVLVEKIVRPPLTFEEIIAEQLIPAKVVAVGRGHHDESGNLIPVVVKEGDVVLLDKFTGTTVNVLAMQYVGTEFRGVYKEYHVYEDDHIVGTLHD